MKSAVVILQVLIASLPAFAANACPWDGKLADEIVNIRGTLTKNSVGWLPGSQYHKMVGLAVNLPDSNCPIKQLTLLLNETQFNNLVGRMGKQIELRGLVGEPEVSIENMNNLTLSPR